MSPLTPRLSAFLDDHRVGVLATIAPDGRPRQSVVYYAREAGAIVISTLDERHKTADVRRTQWASLSVRGDDAPYPSATFSGPAAILTEDIGLATATVVQRVANAAERPEVQTDAALAAVGRVILRIDVDRVAAVSHLT